MILISLFELFLMINLTARFRGAGTAVGKNSNNYLSLAKYDRLPLKVRQVKRQPKKVAMAVEYSLTSNQPNKDQPKKEQPQLQEQPKPVVVQVKSTEAPADLEVLFDKYSSQYGVDKGVMKKIAKCESNFNAGAVNGPYAGIYQFQASTWASNRSEMGLNSDPGLRFNPEEAIKTTAYKISKDGTGAWPVCSR